MTNTVKCANCQHEYVPFRQCASESPLYFCCEDCHWEFNEKYPNLAWCAHCHSPMSKFARSTRAVFYDGVGKPATFFCTDKCYTAWLAEGKITCEFCHQQAPYNPRFPGYCNEKCYGLWVWEGAKEKQEPETKTISPVCPSCGGDANTLHGVWFHGLCFCNTSCKKAFEELGMDRCVRCGKGIPYAPHYYNDLTFCRAYCRDEYKKQHPSYCCAHCGKGFVPSSTSYVHLNGSHFCCHDCFMAYKQSIGESVPRECLCACCESATPFPGHDWVRHNDLRFCCETCKYTWEFDHQDWVKKIKDEKDIHLAYCASCGDSHHRFNYRWIKERGLLFCCGGCQNDYRWEQYKDKRCIECGAEYLHSWGRDYWFKETTGDTSCIFCSGFCRDAYNKKHQGHTAKKHCPICFHLHGSSYCRYSNRHCACCNFVHPKESKWWVLHDGKYFCSTECRDEYKKKQEAKKVHLCAHCNKDCTNFNYRLPNDPDNLRFCSHECLEDRKAFFAGKCIRCGFESKRHRWIKRSEGLFCSSTCEELLKKRGYVGIWQNPKEVITGNELKLVIFD